MVLCFSYKFIECYNKRNEKVQAPVTHIHKTAPAQPKLGHWTIDDTDSSSDNEDCPKAMSAIEPYLEEWNLYLNTNEAVLDNIGIVQWWGAHIYLYSPYISHTRVLQLYGSHYPTWCLLACNYLLIIASSVSSERVSSSASITISKRHNCLNADIVKALQCPKCLIQQDLMVHTVSTLADEEQELNYKDDQPANQDSLLMEVVDTGDKVTWGATSSECKGIPKADGHDTDINLD